MQATQRLLQEKTPPDCILYPDDISCVGGIAAALGTVVLANEAMDALRDDDFDPECGGPYDGDCCGCACEGCCSWTFDPEDEEEYEDPFDAGPEEDPEAPEAYDMSLDEGMYGPVIGPDDEGWEDGGDEGEEDEVCSEI